MIRRRQFTSCDACRKSRIRCDAVNRDGSCTNCVRRKKICSSQWIERFTGGRQRRPSLRSNSRELQINDREVSVGSSLAEVPTNANGASSEPPASTGLLMSNSEAMMNRRQQAMTLHNVLWDIFTSLYEPQLGLWIGTECNPFKRINTAPKTLITRLMVFLDSSSTQNADKSTTERLGLPDMHLSAKDASEQEHTINQALISAVHAFSARWLPLSCFGEVNGTNLPKLIMTKEHFVECIWKRAQKDVTQVLTRPSYRSILALYLFGVTPTSSKNKERPISDHCMETSIRHYTQLRGRKRIAAKQISSEGIQTSERRDGVSTKQDVHEEHQHLEDTAYWFGIVIDGSRSLTRCRPSVLLPGLSGESQVWSLIKTQSEHFGGVYQSIQHAKALLTDETVMTMVQYGLSCKTLFWKAVSRLQEYLFHQTIDLPLEAIVENIEREMKRFEDIFTPFLHQCGSDYILLSQKSRISYLILSFHFHLGILILVDTLDWHHETANIGSIIDTSACRLSSTRAIVNLINLMLSQADTFPGDDTTSIILKDPYPEHTRNGLSRAAYSVLKLYSAVLLPKQVAEIMASSLFAGLEVLRQISYTAAESLNDLYDAYSKSDLVIRRRQTGTSTHLTTVPSTFGSAISPEVFEEETFKQLDLAGEDPFLVNNTIGRHEIHNLPDDFAWFDLDSTDLDLVTQDWSFEDCFSNG